MNMGSRETGCRAYWWTGDLESGEPGNPGGLKPVNPKVRDAGNLGTRRPSMLEVMKSGRPGTWETGNMGNREHGKPGTC